MQILILEDDPIDLELIRKTLCDGGIRGHFVVVSNRQDFLAQLRNSPPDVILADYVLPSFDGGLALDLKNRICPDVPFILVSGVLGEEQAIEALKTGATDYVLKHRMGRLVPSVERALRETQERQQRQQAARALQETDDLLRAIVDASPVGIITMTREQRIITWNTAAEDLYGYTASQIVGHPLPLIPETHQGFFSQCFEQVTENLTVLSQEFKHRTQAGNLIDVSVSLAPLHDASGCVYGIVMTASDITMRKQVERQRLTLLQQESAARAAAESANRLKDEFLAVLSHELRTPLNAIVGWIHLIKKGNLRPDIFQRALDTIERNAAAQTQLIEDLLDLSRVMRGQIALDVRSVDVTHLLVTTVDTLRPAAEAKSIQVSLDVASDVGTLPADLNRLQQICWNLLSNAIKFTPVGGQVDVQAFISQDNLHIEVADSGIGIASDFLPYVFDHFRQADGSATRSHGGLGLGLAICRRLVELHGGTIHADSAGEGQGATFAVVLPLRQNRYDEQLTTPHATAETPSLQGIKAIVLDDEADARELLKITLEQWGMHVVCAGSAAMAYELLETFQPDIIISDVGIPDEDGYTFLRKVRSRPDMRLASVPAIALTAYARDEDRQNALAVGYEEHIPKPFDPETVIDAVRELTNTK